MTPFASAGPATKAAYAATAALLLGAVFVVLTATIVLAGLHQLHGDVRLTAVPHWFWYYRGDPQVRRWLHLGAPASGGLVALLAFGALLNLRRPLHGAARFAHEGELAHAGLREKDGLLLGRKGGAYLSFGGAEHVLLYAPTRSGKGVGVVIPNLLNWTGSVVVLDIKRENFQATAGFRKAHGQAVHLFDPLDPEGRTARYNPLSYIDRGNRTATLDELQKIAVMLFPANEKADPFWAEAARTGFIGVGAYVAETPALPFTLGEIFRQLTQGSPKQRFPEAITVRARDRVPLSAGCVGALTDFCSASDNTFASIKQTITSRMGLWLNPLVDAATSSSDFDLRLIRQAPTSIYLGASPDNMARVAPLYNLFFQQLVDLNCRGAPDPPERRQVLLLMDEFARLGHAGVIAHGFSFVAGYGLRILAVIQSPSQLRAEYGADLTEEILTNCGAEVTFTPKELKVAQELSERLGYYTYGGRSRSRPTALASGRRTTTESDQRRALMLPQELMQMNKDDLVILRAGVAPVRGRKIVYHKSGDFRPRVVDPPVIPPRDVPRPSAEARPSRPDPALTTLAEDVAAIRTAVDEIRTIVVQRPMTDEEAAGEAELSMDKVSLALDDVDMDDLPARGATETEVQEWVAGYLDRATLKEVLDQRAIPPHQPRRSRREPDWLQHEHDLP